MSKKSVIAIIISSILFMTLATAFVIVNKDYFIKADTQNYIETVEQKKIPAETINEDKDYTAEFSEDELLMKYIHASQFVPEFNEDSKIDDYNLIVSALFLDNEFYKESRESTISNKYIDKIINEFYSGNYYVKHQSVDDATYSNGEYHIVGSGMDVDDNRIASAKKDGDILTIDVDGKFIISEGGSLAEDFINLGYRENPEALGQARDAWLSKTDTRIRPDRAYTLVLEKKISDNGKVHYIYKSRKNTLGGNSYIFNRTKKEAENETVKYIRYVNPRFGFSVEVPDFLDAQSPSANGDGNSFVSADGKAKLSVYGSNSPMVIYGNPTIDQMYSEELNNLAYTPDYKTKGENWFVISWKEGSDIKYEKYILKSDGTENVLIISYPKSEEKRYSDIVSHISSSFKSNDN